MKEFIDAVKGITYQDILRLFVIVVGLSGAIWAVIHWSYKTRIRNLKVSLELYKEQFDRMLQTEIEKQVRAHRAEVNKVELENRNKVARLDDDINALNTKLSKMKGDYTLLYADFLYLWHLAEDPTNNMRELSQAHSELGAKYFRK